MELKTNYQYTYFVYPFVIKEGKYQKYILKMLKDENCNLKVFQKEKDLKLYQYFLPKTREFLFSSFKYGNAKIKKLEELPIETRAALLAKNPCNIFEYTLKKDIQGKLEQTEGIFFNIQKIEIICFATGISFLAIKTNVQDYAQFSNILNFNYKFKDINNELENYDNIRIQTDSFENPKTFQEFIRGITGLNAQAAKLNIETDRFLTYSYVCIDQEEWNNTNTFDNVKHQFIKYSNILPADSSKNYEYEKIETFSRWKYAKIGLSKLGMTLFSSSVDMNNYTILPEEYENQYFYTYILNLYKKIYLRKIELEFKDSTKIKNARKKFVEFTKNLWIQEITEDETGTLLNEKLQEVFELNQLYNQVKNKYDILYKELNFEKERTTTIVMLIILVISLILNIINFMGLFRTMIRKRCFLGRGQNTSFLKNILIKKKRGSNLKICCGTDIIEIERVKQCIEDEKIGENFKERVYTKNEIEYCESKKNQKYQHYAGRFAAKEAVFKAISEQIDNKYSITWKDIEILNNEQGKPEVKITGIELKNLQDQNIDVSISHCKQYAVAMVTAICHIPK